MIHSKLDTVGGLKSNTLKTNKYNVDLPSINQFHMCMAPGSLI
jgi:hypothetical protein